MVHVTTGSAEGVRCDHRKVSMGSLPLLGRFGLGICLLFLRVPVLVPLPISGLERFTIGVVSFTRTIVIARPPEITLITHLKGHEDKMALVRNVVGSRA